MRVAWPIMLVLILPILGAYILRLRNPKVGKPKNIAETKTLERLPSFKKVKTRAKALRIIELSIIGIVLVALSLLIARPQSTVLKIDEERTRDIVMCIDTSGSMRDFHQPSIQITRETVQKNPADKYAIVLFSNVSLTALPLTRDIASINLKLDDLEEHLHPDNYSNEYKNASSDYSLDNGGTDITAGLTGCLKRFSNLESARSRHVIFVSDVEDTNGSDPSEVTRLYAKYGVKLHVLYPDSYYAEAIENNSALKLANAELNSFAREDGINNTLTSIFSTIQNQDDALTYAVADDPYPYFILVPVLMFALTGVGIAREGWRKKK